MLLPLVPVMIMILKVHVDFVAPVFIRMKKDRRRANLVLKERFPTLKQQQEVTAHAAANRTSTATKQQTNVNFAKMVIRVMVKLVPNVMQELTVQTATNTGAGEVLTVKNLRHPMHHIANHARRDATK